MSLHSNGRNRNALIFEPLQQRQGTASLTFVFERVIVVCELGLRVGLMCVFERFGDIYLADDLQPQRLPQTAILVQCFVDDVPTLNPSLIAPNHRLNVVMQASQERLPIHEIPVGVAENPGGSLVVPDESMSDDEHAALL